MGKSAIEIVKFIFTFALCSIVLVRVRVSECMTCRGQRETVPFKTTTAELRTICDVPHQVKRQIGLNLLLPVAPSRSAPIDVGLKRVASEH